MATSDFDEFVEQYHLALNEFFSGNPEPAKTLYSHREDASLANPFGPVTTGWKQVAETMERAASNYREGEATGFERAAKYVTEDLAYIVEVERFKAKVGGSEETVSGALRVHEHPSPRRRRVEDLASTRGSDNDSSARGNRNSEVDLQPARLVAERTTDGRLDVLVEPDEVPGVVLSA